MADGLVDVNNCHDGWKVWQTQEGERREWEDERMTGYGGYQTLPNKEKWICGSFGGVHGDMWRTEWV